MAQRQDDTFFLPEMMKRLGIDPDFRVIAHSELTMLTAVHQCRDCKGKSECRAWLDEAPISFAFAPGFCPNKDLLFEMQFDQAGPVPDRFAAPCAVAERAAFGTKGESPGRESELSNRMA